MKIFVTGGTGYLGTRLVSALSGAGHSVTALARNPGAAAALATVGTRIVEGDVADFDAAGVDLAGFDAVMHAAALVKTRADDASEFDRVNVQGVANVARRALEAGVGRFIYTSSFMALGPSPDGAAISESADNDSCAVHNDYERTKHLGLIEFERWVAQGLPGLSLMPCVVYGPGALTSGNLVSKVVAEIVRGAFPGVLGDGRLVWTYSYIEDVVAGHLAALEKGRTGERYILGGESVTMEGFVRMVAELAGVDAPKRRIPFWLAKAGAAVEECCAAARRREPALTRQIVEVYRHHWTYSSDKAIKELGYRVTPLKQGLAQTVSWVKLQLEQGRLGG